MPTPNVAFLRDNPGIEQIDLLLPDANGLLRGKKINAVQIDKAFDDGILLPRSVYGTDICGDTVRETKLGIATGDQDYVCRPEPDTLRLVPWADIPSAQCMMEMYDDDGRPYYASPRQTLRSVVARLHDDGVFPTVAVELEFYLFRNRLDDDGMPRLMRDPVTGDDARSTQVYSVDDLDHHQPFLDATKKYADAQRVPASGAIAEYAPGQFEINLHHCDDPVAACDDAIYLKRIIRHAAREQGLTATFMAKPMADLAGSGMHIHMSASDADGKNIFAADRASLEHAVGGLQRTMADAMLCFAPHANSYRRFQARAYVPLAPSWGYNNRTVALRIPAGPDEARRIEHRVAGADANPYLVMAAVLAGAHHGIATQARPDDPIDGDAAELSEPTLPLDWLKAIERFAASAWARDYFGDQFCELFATIKRSECAVFQRTVPPLDIEWYLRTV